MSCQAKALPHRLAENMQEELEKLFQPSKRRIILLAGPTGVGKTALSIELAKRLGGEIVSADSVQVYRGMDIGTAKIPIEERQDISHHLIDVCDVKDHYNVVQYYEDAKAACVDILRRGKVPIVVGGTGFYLHALLYGPPSGPPANPEVRKKLQEDVDKFGVELLYEKLEKLDPQYAKTITKNDAHKVVRALEIIEVTGRKVSSFAWRDRALEPYFDFRAWFIFLPREELYSKLDLRCDAMLQKGLLEEVKHLEKKGLRQNPTASTAIGYKQCLEYLATPQTENDYKKFVEAFKIATRHLVKRQFTWFRREPLFRWLNISEVGFAECMEMLINDYQQRGTTTLDFPEELG